MDAPIACTLTASEADRQLGEWQEVLGRTVTGVARTGPGELRFALGSRLDDLATVVELAQREKACCQFFEFSLEIGSDELCLVVRAPDEAAPILDGLAAMIASR